MEKHSSIFTDIFGLQDYQLGLVQHLNAASVIALSRCIRIHKDAWDIMSRKHIEQFCNVYENGITAKRTIEILDSSLAHNSAQQELQSYMKKMEGISSHKIIDLLLHSCSKLDNNETHKVLWKLYKASWYPCQIVCDKLNTDITNLQYMIDVEENFWRHAATTLNNKLYKDLEQIYANLESMYHNIFMLCHGVVHRSLASICAAIWESPSLLFMNTAAKDESTYFAVIILQGKYHFYFHAENGFNIESSNIAAILDKYQTCCPSVTLEKLESTRQILLRDSVIFENHSFRSLPFVFGAVVMNFYTKYQMLYIEDTDGRCPFGFNFSHNFSKKLKKNQWSSGRLLKKKHGNRKDHHHEHLHDLTDQMSVHK